MSSLSLDEEPGGYRLTRIDAAGAKTEIVLSEDDILTLAQSSQRIQEHIHAGRSPKGGAISSVTATPVAQFHIAPDLLHSEVLLTMIAPSGAQVRFALPLDVAKLLADRLPVHIALAAKTISQSKN